MKKSILLIIALAAAAQAQQAVPCLRLSKVTDNTVTQQESTIAQLTFKAQNCAVLHLEGLTTATFVSLPGLDMSVMYFTFTDLDETPAGAGNQKASELSLLLRLSPSPDLAVGEHTFHGLLTYQVLDASGNPAPETLPIDFPFTVAPPKPYKAVAPPNNGAPQEETGFVHGLKTAGMVIVGIPIFIVLALVCTFTGNCWEC